MAHVIERIGPEVHSIYAIDDDCPEQTGLFLKEVIKDPRLSIIFHENNQGVGGAVITGYKRALDDGMDIIVKIDGDGQMHPELIPQMISPILRGRADYVKGNRFDSLESLAAMPKLRIVGNAALSILTKFSTGYWSVTDPTNGFTAIHKTALQSLNLAKIRKSYFFESDILFRLNLANCVVHDVPMEAVYGEEKSNMRLSRILIEFPMRHFVNFSKRIFYRYYLREWSVGTFELPIGITLLGFGIVFGLNSYFSASQAGIATSAGQATTSALAIILGMQLLLSFLSFDVNAEPQVPRQAP